MDFSLAWNADFIDAQYQLWRLDPGKVSREWRIFFEGFELAGSPEREVRGICDRDQVLKQARVQELIHRYRDIGHLLACLDPLAACPVDHPLFSLSILGLDEEDLDRVFHTPKHLGKGQSTLRDLVGRLREIYCRSVGVEYMHVQDPGERLWLHERLESTSNTEGPTAEDKLRILNKLCQATLFEQFIHTRYVGQKRFSVEGAEGVVAMLDALVHHASGIGCREIILGMAHRGRLNVQVNVLEKPYETVFCEFEDNYDPDSIVGAGDVKYHKGYLADLTTRSGNPMRILLVSNPSHLESVNPVVEGIARARQEQMEDEEQQRVLPVLIHGDSAFSGQGIVCETLNLSQLEGYRTGGTLHIVINNQIGFTTLPENARSTRYSTDVAKMLMVPVFHVHGEDPEAAVRIMKLACEYRMQFKKDIVIDLVCYRRYGHNEGDEPYYTQPQMYERIKERPVPYRLYAEKLLQEGLVTEQDVERIRTGIEMCLEEGSNAARSRTCAVPEARFYEDWKDFEGGRTNEPVDTGVSKEVLLSLARKLSEYPEHFSVHPRLRRILDRRLEAVEKGEGIDWAGAEALAFASLLAEGTPVRLSGQDSRRGTFSQRHSVLTDVKTGEQYIPLSHLGKNQAPFHVYDSMLSENAVLGFEYGYSLVNPRSLVIWEAQFGDFANNAQVMIDQYISSGEQKWRRFSGLVLLLPHGFEGQGAEHSSARLERFLQLCAQDNLQVCNPTTPAQYFHLLRRQVMRTVRKPLIVLAPKSLLRHPGAVSKIDELVSGRFEELLDDVTGTERIERVISCSGKVYYDLVERRSAAGASGTAIVRLEQFYPFPEGKVEEIARKYSSAREWIWVQEEPENMGGWSFVKDRLRKAGVEPGYVGRPASASPASGYHSVHKAEQAALVERAIPEARGPAENS